MTYLKIAMICSVVNFVANNEGNKIAIFLQLAAILFSLNESEAMTSHYSNSRRWWQKIAQSCPIQSQTDMVWNYKFTIRTVWQIVKSRDIVKDRDSLLELEIESDGVMRPFMFEPWHGTSSEDESDSNMAQDLLEAVEANTDETTLSCLTNHDWCTSINCLTYSLFWDIK